MRAAYKARREVVVDRADAWADSRRTMKTPIVILLAVAMLLCGCTKSGTGLSGEWKLRLGKSVQTLRITEEGGRISGTVLIDKAWGGETTELSGLHVGKRVELLYTANRITAGKEITYTYEGTAEGDRMSGTCQLVGSPELLWVAERTKAGK